jgi:lactate dehydrogenase-like 2-hydroxyacid dehydrogenase
MKIVILEHLNVKENVFQESIHKYLPTNAKIIFYHTRPQNQAELIARANDADVLVIANMPLRTEVLKKCRNLKMISIAFTGIDHVDVAYCHERGIVVSNCAGYSTEAVAELVIGMALSLYRKLIICDAATRNGKTSQDLFGWELKGKTFGIIGTGAIGLQTCALAQAFGCKILAYSRTIKDYPDINYVSLDILLKESDIVSIHVPLTPATKNMINTEQLALMKPTAILLNTARGSIVNSTALADALNKKIIAGAGLDVFDIEPPLDPENDLMHTKNTILSPHIGFATEEALISRCNLCLKNVACWLNSSPINLV